MARIADLEMINIFKQSGTTAFEMCPVLLETESTFRLVNMQLIHFNIILLCYKVNLGKADFSDQFRKNIVRYKRIGYNINIIRHSACLVFNPITVNNFASLFICTPVGRASDSMMAST